MKSLFHPLLPCIFIFGGAHAYELHEWGTFTTVSGSDGVLLTGLQREEEPLPSFVHSHLGMENGGSPEQRTIGSLLNRYGTLWPMNPADGFSGKGLSKRPVVGVTVKMETPVIYFHSDHAFKAKVDVGFEGGTISQWYPARSGGESLPLPPVPADPKKNPVSVEQWRIDFSKGYRGAISWSVDVLSPAESSETMTFKPKETIGWMRARVPEANVIRSGEETESYLFYRGIGNFAPGLEVKVDAAEKLVIRNLTGGEIPYLLVYEKRNMVTTWKAFENGLAENGQCEVASKDLDPRPDQLQTMANDPVWWAAIADHGSYDAAIYESLKSGLTQTGLLPSEADAMIRTWWESYFEAEGTRIFWILPQSKIEKILPLKVEPTPEKIVRVIVGRSEILRPRREKEWLAQSKIKSRESSDWDYLVSRDRFGLAIKERIAAMAKSPETLAK